MRRQAPQRFIRSLTVPGTGPNVPRLGRLIPVPDAPVKPILSLAEFLHRPPARIPSILDAGNVVHLTTGRVAIALALESLGLKPGDKVLVPAYHCASMIMPLNRVEAEPVYYRVGDDLSVDLGDIEAKIDGATKALMVTHYFGFPQDMPRIRQFCDDHGLALIEDCAHSFFGRIAGRPIGSFGDFAIGSQRKFFPVFDGGCLISPTISADRVATQEQGAGANLKAVLTLSQDAIGFGRLPALRPFVDGLKAVRNLARGAATEVDESVAEASGNPAEDNSGGFDDFDGAWMDKKPMVVSRAVLGTFSKGYVIARRRQNYAALLHGLGDLPGCRPQFPELPDDVVPYMFPIWIDDLDAIFPCLEDEAVPMQRFGQFLAPGIDESVCEVSAQRSHHSVQLPCHQALSEADLALIIDRVRRAVRGASRPKVEPKSEICIEEEEPVS
jgi:dTDP-4-amino-4,6-dideoxygalactose transaminase